MGSTTKPSIELDFDYEFVEGVLADADCEVSAAEIQAILCGLLSAGFNESDKSWIGILEDMVNNGQSLGEQAVQVIGQLLVWTNQQLGEQESLCPLFLPDDSFAAIDQLEALIVWSEGFLLGFGLQVRNQPVKNREVNESLMDLAEISNLELEAEDNEETQEALFTLIEHIKVAVQLVYWEMVIKHNADSIPENTTVH